MRPKIAAIIIHFGEAEPARNCARSFLAHCDSAEYELRMFDVDNGSPEVLSPETMPAGCTVIRVSESLGYSHGVNEGIRAATQTGADAFLVINNDTILCSDVVFEFLKASRESPDSILAPVIFSDLACEHPDEFGGHLNDFTMYFRNLTAPPAALKSVTFITGACLFLPGGVVRTIGALDERFFMYGEDMDYCIRARRQRVPLIVVPTAKVFHRKGGSTGGVAPFSMYYVHRNRVLLARKHLHRAYFAFLLVYSLIILGKMVKWGVPRPDLAGFIFRGFLDGVRQIEGKHPGIMPARVTQHV